MIDRVTLEVLFFFPPRPPIAPRADLQTRAALAEKYNRPKLGFSAGTTLASRPPITALEWPSESSSNNIMLCCSADSILALHEGSQLNWDQASDSNGPVCWQISTSGSSLLGPGLVFGSGSYHWVHMVARQATKGSPRSFDALAAWFVRVLAGWAPNLS